MAKNFLHVESGISVPGLSSDPSGAANGDLYYNTTSNVFRQYINGGWANVGTSSTTGTVTSVAMTVPSFLSVSGSPITSSGTLALSLSGTALPVANGGTGQTSLGNLTDAGTDGITVTGGTGALITSASISQHVADTTHNGYLSSTDWNTFNGKQSALTIGNLTDAGTDGITVTGGTGAVIGSGTSISQHVADTTHNGYLSSTDWNTFNGKGSGTVTSVAMTVPSFLSVSGSPVTSSGTLAVTLSGTALPIANGGTGQTSASAAFNALSPITSTGDLILGNGANSATRLAIGTNNYVLTSNGSTASWQPASAGSFTPPTIQTFTLTNYYTFTVTAANATVGATYTNNGQTFTVVYTIAAGTTLVCSATGAPASSGTLTKASGTGDSTISFSSQVNTGTYRRPATTPLYIRVRMVGGGGGGGGGSAAANATAGGAGGNSTFGSSLLTANGGGGGSGTAATGGAGGSASISAPATGVAFQGGAGTGSCNQNNTSGNNNNVMGGAGAASPFGGSGAGGAGNNSGSTVNAIANTGSGGGGGGSATPGFPGAGGGAGGFVDAVIGSPSATYSFAIGAGGTSGTGAGGGPSGGTGGSGIIEVTEYYQ